MLKLYLIRHGETNANTRNKINGRSDFGLSKTGLSQAKKLAKRFSKIKIDAIYSSTLKRAIQTAEEIAKCHKLKVMKKKELNERSYGILEGLTPEEALKRYPRLYKHAPYVHYKPPKGESLNDAQKRVMPFTKNLIKKHDNQSILIVSHGRLNSIIIAWLLGMPLANAPFLRQKNTCINEIDIHKKYIEVHSLNDSSHLKL